MTSAGRPRFPLPESVRQSLDEFSAYLGLELSLWVRGGGPDDRLYPDRDAPNPDRVGTPAVRGVSPRDGSALELRVWPRPGDPPPTAEGVADLVSRSLERALDAAHEIRFFTFELSERYEEINLLYSISETLGSILRLDDAARVILSEVCDVMGARRGSLWVHEPADGLLRLVASVGTDGVQGPLRADESPAVTARVFRESRPMMAQPVASGGREVEPSADDERETFLSVPIRYSPPEGEARTVGVINLIGRSYAGRFTASDQKLLSAIATQVGAALENNRLIRQSLQRERLEREMELAHNLQQKLLPAVERFDGVPRRRGGSNAGGAAWAATSTSSSSSRASKVGVMLGDVSQPRLPRRRSS